MTQLESPGLAGTGMWTQNEKMVVVFSCASEILWQFSLSSGSLPAGIVSGYRINLEQREKFYLTSLLAYTL